MSTNENGNVTFTVKEMLQSMDAKWDAKFDSLDSKLDTALVQMESKVDRQRVHDLTSVVAAINLAKVEHTEFDTVNNRVSALENQRSRLIGAISVVGFLASIGAFHLFFG